MSATATATATDRTDRFQRLAPLEEARGHVRGGAPVGAAPGSALPALREAAAEVRELVRASGHPAGVTTRDLITQPHPTAYGLFRAARSPAPWLWVTDRMLVVCWEDAGRTRTLLWGPGDHELDDTPAMRRLRERLPVPARLVTRRHGTVLEQLRSLGIDRRDIDHVGFDHLHTQDLRRLLGTTGPAPDVGSPDGPVAPWFPNATLLVQRAEWDTVRQPHPLQSPWYRPRAYDDLPPERIELLDGDQLLGPGVALVCTPGHTLGNQSLVLHTDRGVEVVSGNGVVAEAWNPAEAELPGLRAHTRETGLEVIPRASTLEFASWQYGSMVAEAVLADRTGDGRFPLVLPNGELRPHPLAPGLRPALRVEGLEFGSVRPSRVTAA